MWFNKKTYQVYRKTLDADGLGESWSFINDIIGSLMSVSASDAIRNNQDFADVRNLLICTTAYKGMVQDQDELIGPDGARYHVRTYQEMDNVLPHIEMFLGDPQWNGEIDT